MAPEATIAHQIDPAAGTLLLQGPSHDCLPQCSVALRRPSSTKVARLIRPRSASRYVDANSNHCRKRFPTRRRVVTATEFPGHISMHSGLPSLARARPTVLELSE